MSHLALTTDSVAATESLAACLGQVVRGHEVFELRSDVGGGKTTFTKGLGRGLEIDDPIQSPTFTISRLYKARNNLELHHFDFYRLQDAGIMSAELAESLTQPNAIVVVEWADVVESVLPDARIQITISTTSEMGRLLTIDIPEKFAYLAQALQQWNEQRNIA
jgi:tRNA threonylcarbamoyladenosine biosynthesis protein TsaE